MEIPWSERVNMLSINPDAASRDDVAKMAAELSDAKAIEEERDRLREAVELLIGFIPEGWEMPLGWTQVVAQAKAALAGKEKG